MELKELLMFMTKKEASDLHLKPMRPPLLRIQGRLIPVKATPLKPDDIERMLEPVMNPALHKVFEEKQAVDIGYGVPGVARFRCNVFKQRGTMAAVFRRVPFDILTAEELNLPDVIETFTDFPSGLVLVTGPTGSGKSTTLAALVHKIASERPCHVVTIEDPIEFLFSDDKATISQREIGTDTPSFQEALRNCMRQDPDVIMVGEMRDLPTISTAITAAETGHLVFSTLHTNSAAQTIDRIIDAFPPDQQDQVRNQLGLVLKAIVSMTLVENKEGSARVPATEILVNAPKISRHIELGEIKEIAEEMEKSVSYYKMQSMNQSLISLLAHDVITYDEAVKSSWDPEDLSLKLRKMFPSIEEKFRGGEMAPSAADFSQITELLETRDLYEEMEERHQVKIQEKDDRISDLEAEVTDLRVALEENSGTSEESNKELDQAKAELLRIRDDSEKKINALNERIRDLNQKLSGQGGGSKPTTGFFKR